MRREKIIRVIGLAVIIFAACLAGSFLGIGMSRSLESDSKKYSGGPSHNEVHEALSLTPEQLAALVPIEKKARKREDELKAKLKAANSELAAVIVSERANSPKVEKAVENIHQLMAELQQVTLEHLFSMEKTLTPEQYDKLLQHAGENLSH